MKKLLVLLMLVLSLASCKKGEIGPEGPAGPAGNANVVSKIFLPANITWRQTTLYGTNYVTASLDLPEITDEVLNGGSVQVYGGFF
ncbi:hypothetical protein G5B35_21005, partial [Parapusillimonas sp. SGNA-6]|nr:hypothetical protein [Parapusillimonas sp. SGNA-6]